MAEPTRLVPREPRSIMSAISFGIEYGVLRGDSDHCTPYAVITGSVGERVGRTYCIERKRGVRACVCERE